MNFLWNSQVRVWLWPGKEWNQYLEGYQDHPVCLLFAFYPEHQLHFHLTVALFASQSMWQNMVAPLPSYFQTQG